MFFILKNILGVFKSDYIDIDQKNIVQADWYQQSTDHMKWLESIQGTCRLSLKMGKGGEQKTVMSLYLAVINIDLTYSEMSPLSNNGTFKSMCWTFVCRLNILYQQSYPSKYIVYNSIINARINIYFVSCILLTLCLD